MILRKFIYFHEFSFHVYAVVVKGLHMQFNITYRIGSF